jgi:hypothetical protein
LPPRRPNPLAPFPYWEGGTERRVGFCFRSAVFRHRRRSAAGPHPLRSRRGLPRSDLSRRAASQAQPRERGRSEPVILKGAEESRTRVLRGSRFHIRMAQRFRRHSARGHYSHAEVTSDAMRFRDSSAALRLPQNDKVDFRSGPPLLKGEGLGVRSLLPFPCGKGPGVRSLHRARPRSATAFRKNS